jgi:hypothetical protein
MSAPAGIFSLSLYLTPFNSIWLGFWGEIVAPAVICTVQGVWPQALSTMWNARARIRRSIPEGCSGWGNCRATVGAAEAFPALCGRNPPQEDSIRAVFTSQGIIHVGMVYWSANI